jgi:WbqC-like protein
MPTERVVAVHQPNYLPYLGFFQKMAAVDLFVLYDTAKFSRNGLTNRNKIKTPTGVQWLTVPVRRSRGQPIKEVEIASPVWAKKHLKSLQANYQSAPYFSSYFSDLRHVLAKDWTQLSDLNTALIETIRQWLRIDTKIVSSSALSSPPSDDATDKIIHFTSVSGGSVYLSGPSGKNYLRPEMFAKVALRVSEFAARPYPQLYGGFQPNLSSIDAIFNCGERTRELLEIPCA